MGFFTLTPSKMLAISIAAVGSLVGTYHGGVYKQRRTVPQPFDNAVSLDEFRVAQRGPIAHDKQGDYLDGQYGITELSTSFAYLEVGDQLYPAIVDRGVSCGDGVPGYRLWGSYKDYVLSDPELKIRPRLTRPLDDPSHLFDNKFGLSAVGCYGRDAIHPFGIADYARERAPAYNPFVPLP